MMEWLTDVKFAHRGLHDLSAGVPENSLASFEAAVVAGYGVELDVRLSADGHAIVFHDKTLDAVTDQTGPVFARTAEELGGMRLMGTEEAIPSLKAVLDLIAGRVPVLVEIKNPGLSVGALENAVLNVVRGYDGELAVISFNARSLRWFLDNAAKLPRGRSVIGLWSTSGTAPFWRRALMPIINAFVPSDPDFLTIDLPALGTGKQSLPVIAWTVRTPREQERAEKLADGYIFENMKF